VTSARTCASWSSVCTVALTRRRFRCSARS
jgi:hypothetical protein